MSFPFGRPYPSMERRAVDKIIRELDVLVRLSGVPHLQRSHPYLPDIAKDTQQQLRLILQQNRGHDLAHNTYMQVTVQSLLRKTAQAIDVLQGGSASLQEEGAPGRRKLVKLSLIFSHILAELKAIFPGGRYQGGIYRITKLEAAKFWAQTFGQRCLVQWAEFQERLHKVHAIEPGPLEYALRSTMDLTCNDHVSVFEFDTFTRLFQPWDMLLQNWMVLAVTHPGYMAFLTYDEVRVYLRSHIHRPGSYIFRLSCTHLGQWAIGYVTSEGNILQTIPHNKSLHQALLDGEREGLYLYPNGQNKNPDLSELCSTSTSAIHVTREQWELYSDMDSTFELCKICADRMKNVRIQPCGHLLCDQCLTAWQKSDGQSCPFCRCEIRGKEEIFIFSQSEFEQSETTDTDKESWITSRPLPNIPDNDTTGSSDSAVDSDSSLTTISPSSTQIPTSVNSLPSASTMPSAPFAPSPIVASPAPSIPSAPWLTHKPQAPPVPPKKKAIKARDVINGSQETSGSRITRVQQVPHTVQWGRQSPQPNTHR
ncbi:E3 ubiquitin-protein ligase CBL-C [Discoglossus pictus]